MRIMCIAVLLLVGVAVVCPSAFATRISQRDYDFFRKKSDAEYGTDTQDLEQQFYWISAGAKNPEAAIDRFSRRLRVSVDTAAAYADAIIKAVKFRDACDRERITGQCNFTPHTPLYDALRGAGFLDKSGAVAIVIGKSLPRRTQSADQVRRRFIKVVVTHPARADILKKLFDYDEEPIWEAAHLALDPRDAAFANDVFDKIARGDLYHGSDWSGSRMAALDMARREVGAARNTGDAYVGYTKAIMALQLRLGLGADAVDTYRKMAPRLRGIFSNRKKATTVCPRWATWRSILRPHSLKAEIMPPHCRC